MKNVSLILNIIFVLMFAQSIVRAEGNTTESTNSTETTAEQNGTLLYPHEIRHQIPIERYQEQADVEAWRAHMRGSVEPKYHQYFQTHLGNITELSVQGYCLYLKNCTTEEYLGNSPNATKYVLLFLAKGDQLSLAWSQHLQNNSAALHDAGFKLLYVDRAIDLELVHAFDAQMSPHVFVVEDDKTYSFEYRVAMSDFDQTADWLLNGTYKDSMYQSQLPNYMGPEEQAKYARRQEIYYAYAYLLQPLVRLALSTLPKAVLHSPPVAAVFDAGTTDLFRKKLWREMAVVFAFMLVSSCISIALFRRLCCTKKVYVVVAKNGRRKRMED